MRKKYNIGYYLGYGSTFLIVCLANKSKSGEILERNVD
jgi:hypothetical protein